MNDTIVLTKDEVLVNTENKKQIDIENSQFKQEFDRLYSITSKEEDKIESVFKLHKMLNWWITANYVSFFAMTFMLMGIIFPFRFLTLGSIAFFYFVFTTLNPGTEKNRRFREMYEERNKISRATLSMKTSLQKWLENLSPIDIFSPVVQGIIKNTLEKVNNSPMINQLYKSYVGQQNEIPLQIDPQHMTVLISDASSKLELVEKCEEMKAKIVKYLENNQSQVMSGIYSKETWDYLLSESNKIGYDNIIMIYNDLSNNTPKLYEQALSNLGL